MKGKVVVVVVVVILLDICVYISTLSSFEMRASLKAAHSLTDWRSC